MENNNLMVTICLERYGALLNIETRVDILRDYLNTNEYPNSVEILRILGYISDAERLIRKNRDKEDVHAN